MIPKIDRACILPLDGETNQVAAGIMPDRNQILRQGAALDLVVDKIALEAVMRAIVNRQEPIDGGPSAILGSEDIGFRSAPILCARRKSR